MVVEIYNDVQTSKVMLESLPFDEHIKKAYFYSKYMKLTFIEVLSANNGS